MLINGQSDSWSQTRTDKAEDDKKRRKGERSNSFCWRNFFQSGHFFIVLVSFAMVLPLGTTLAAAADKKQQQHSSSGGGGSSSVGKVFSAVTKPRINTTGRLHRVKVGETLTLPCKVEDLGSFVLLWKKGHRVFTAGNTIVRRDRRIALRENNLQIADMNIHDGGEYSCEIEADDEEPIAVVHTVEIMVPPSIMPEPLNGQVVVRKGTTVSLECKANGNPAPSVSWAKVGAVDSGLVQVQGREMANNGMILTLDNVSRLDAGRYQCTATNGVGRDAVEYIHLQVLYKPEVLVPEPIAQGGEELPITLTCRVHADPPATVAWYKNTMPVDTSPRYRVISGGGGGGDAENERGHHSLVMQSVGIEDFANYTCLAVNSMGKEEGRIELRGNPQSPELDPVVRQVGQDVWRLSWITKSFANITEYRLLYRKIPTHVSQHDLAYAWNNVILPRQTAHLGSEQFYSYDIQSLHAEATYEAQVQAKNKFGWSERSDSLKFNTNKHVTTERPTYNPPTHASHTTRQRNVANSGGGVGGGPGEGKSANAQEFGINSSRGFSKTFQVLMALLSLLITYLVDQLAAPV